ncbi:site-specific integrase [Hymenobacter sediminicola]|uniref:Tyrosine-type recombinase/integrase n=1 Tax=Hymenobacter sediminicola TaxID=2761579 RepID=A0A7G7W2W8_9BACT|nr:site-specific integrase [Hymenobacter sediminicola]QNH60711.1 tyrosine-type recombinase/integrase [Hymenobacter sediminicola]
MKLRFYLHSKAASDGRRPVYVSIGVGEARPVRSATGVVVHPKYFNELAPHIHRSADGATSHNDRLDEIRLLVGRAVRQLEDAGTLSNAALLPQVKKIISELTGRKTKGSEAVAAEVAKARPLAEQPFRAVYQQWKEEKAGKFTADYLNKGSQYVDWFETFDPGCTPAAVDQRWVNRYTSYLVKETPMFNNTIAQHINSLRVLMQFAGLPTKWIDNDWEHDIEPVYLTQQELEQLIAWQLPAGKGSWDRQKDVFVMRCLTGLRYSDAAALLRPHIKAAAALRMIRMDQKKTRSAVQIPLLPLVEIILAKYEHLPAGQVLPVISRQQTGGIIKEILKAAGIDSPYMQVRYKGTVKHEAVLPKWQAASTHTARHTYGALLARMKLHPLQIMEKMGHKDLKSTMKYTHLEHEATEQQMIEGWDKLQSGKLED